MNEIEIEFPIIDFLPHQIEPWDPQQCKLEKAFGRLSLK